MFKEILQTTDDNVKGATPKEIPVYNVNIVFFFTPLPKEGDHSEVRQKKINENENRIYDHIRHFTGTG